MGRRGFLMLSLIGMTGCVPFSAVSGVSVISVASTYSDESRKAIVADNLSEEGVDRVVEALIRALDLKDVSPEDMDAVREELKKHVMDRRKSRNDALFKEDKPKKILSVDHHGD